MKPYVPGPLPPLHINWHKLAPRIGQANAALARYDGLLQTMLNPEILLSPLTVNEAVLSSKIEGTQASLDEVLEYDAGMRFDESKNTDIQEVKNYRSALLAAEEAIDDGYAISLNLVKTVHQILMKNVRGERKSPGTFRKAQNWIGRHGCSMEEARFVPPSPMLLQESLDKWAAYTSSEEGDILSQLGIIHAQFEIIHPFMDGNGRVGRILMPIYLYKRGFLHRPMFYLSEYLEEHRSEYYDALLSITSEVNWQRWLEFFLTAVIEQASRNFMKAREIVALYERLKGEIVRLTKSQFALPALDTLFAHPIFSSRDFMTKVGIKNRATANTILTQLRSGGLITEIKPSSGRSPAIYAFHALLNIAEGKKMI